MPKETKNETMVEVPKKVKATKKTSDFTKEKPESPIHNDIMDGRYSDIVGRFFIQSARLEETLKGIPTLIFISGSRYTETLLTMMCVLESGIRFIDLLSHTIFKAIMNKKMDPDPKDVSILLTSAWLNIRVAIESFINNRNIIGNAPLYKEKLGTFDVPHEDIENLFRLICDIKEQCNARLIEQFGDDGNARGDYSFNNLTSIFDSCTNIKRMLTYRNGIADKYMKKACVEFCMDANSEYESLTEFAMLAKRFYCDGISYDNVETKSACIALWVNTTSFFGPNFGEAGISTLCEKLCDLYVKNTVLASDATIKMLDAIDAYMRALTNVISTAQNGMTHWTD